MFLHTPHKWTTNVTMLRYTTRHQILWLTYTILHEMLLVMMLADNRKEKLLLLSCSKTPQYGKCTPRKLWHEAQPVRGVSDSQWWADAYAQCFRNSLVGDLKFISLTSCGLCSWSKRNIAFSDSTFLSTRHQCKGAPQSSGIFFTIVPTGTSFLKKRCTHAVYVSLRPCRSVHGSGATAQSWGNCSAPRGRDAIERIFEESDYWILMV